MQWALPGFLLGLFAAVVLGDGTDCSGSSPCSRFVQLVYDSSDTTCDGSSTIINEHWVTSQTTEDYCNDMLDFASGNTGSNYAWGMCVQRPFDGSYEEYKCYDCSSGTCIFATPLPTMLPTPRPTLSPTTPMPTLSPTTPFPSVSPTEPPFYLWKGETSTQSMVLVLWIFLAIVILFMCLPLCFCAKNPHFAAFWETELKLPISVRGQGRGWMLLDEDPAVAAGKVLAERKAANVKVGLFSNAFVGRIEEGVDYDELIKSGNAQMRTPKGQVRPANKWDALDDEKQYTTPQQDPGRYSALRSEFGSPSVVRLRGISVQTQGRMSVRSNLDTPASNTLSAAQTGSASVQSYRGSRKSDEFNPNENEGQDGLL